MWVGVNCTVTWSEEPSVETTRPELSLEEMITIMTAGLETSTAALPGTGETGGHSLHNL